MSEWRPMDSAPSDRRVLVNFKGAGPIVAYRDPEYPEMWVRYLGYGKSTSWPTVHEDFATAWMDIIAPPTDQGDD